MSARPKPVVPLGTPVKAWPAGPVTLTVPGEDAVAVHVAMPRNLRRRAAARVAENAVAEVLAAPADTLHIVFAPDQPGAAIAVAEEQVTVWQGQVRASGRRVAGVIPDYLTLPWHPGTWTVFIEETRGRVEARLGAMDGFAAEPPLADLILARRLGAGDGAPSRIQVHGDAALLPTFRAALDAYPGAARAEPVGPLRVPGPAGLTLLSGRFGDGGDLGKALRAWRVAAVLALTALGLWTAETVFDIRTTEAALQRTNAEIARVFDTRIAPGEPIVDIRLQTARQLDALRRAARAPAARAQFVALMAAGVPALQAHATRIKEIRYQDLTLIVGLEVASFARLETLTQSLRQAGLETEIRSSSASADAGVSGVLALAPLRRP
ncbi:MAG: type II secretion system protein GspL [Pseudomonadota bacterium]